VENAHKIKIPQQQKSKQIKDLLTFKVFNSKKPDNDNGVNIPQLKQFLL